MNNVAVMPSPVDEDGNLSFNFSEGLIVPVREYNEGGTEINISTAAYFFNAANGAFRIALGIDPNNPLGLRLVLSREQLKTIPTPCLFSLTDESNVVPISLWEGTFSERKL